MERGFAWLALDRYRRGDRRQNRRSPVRLFMSDIRAAILSKVCKLGDSFDTNQLAGDGIVVSSDRTGVTHDGSD